MAYILVRGLILFYFRVKFITSGVNIITSGVKFFIVRGQIYCIGGLKLCLHPHSYVSSSDYEMVKFTNIRNPIYPMTEIKLWDCIVLVNSYRANAALDYESPSLTT